MTETERAKQLANNHWDGYVSELVGMHSGCYTGKFYTHEEMLKLCEFHYKTAAAHFHGHGVEDERNGMFRPRIGEPLTTGEIAAIARPCSNCMDESKCNGGLRLTSGDCLHHRPKVAKSCKNCDCLDHCGPGQSGAAFCMGWQPKISDQQYPKVG